MIDDTIINCFTVTVLKLYIPSCRKVKGYKSQKSQSISFYHLCKTAFRPPLQILEDINILFMLNYYVNSIILSHTENHEEFD